LSFPFKSRYAIVPGSYKRSLIPTRENNEMSPLGPGCESFGHSSPHGQSQPLGAFESWMRFPTRQWGKHGGKTLLLRVLQSSRRKWVPRRRFMFSILPRTLSLQWPFAMAFCGSRTVIPEYQDIPAAE
jgi:hypothetical protein